MLFLVFVLLSLIVRMCTSIDYMPCTEGVTAADMALAQRVLDQSTPDGYRLIEINPETRTGRNPHRWVCRFERIDGVYRHDCDFLTSVKTAFKRDCPLGCEISHIAITASPIRNYISVEFLVNCGCRKVPRRRRYARCSSNLFQFKPEASTCSGFTRKHI